VTVAVHVEYGVSNPPAGMLMVKRSVDPDTLPDNVPRPVTGVPVKLNVAVPDTVASLCAIESVMSPGPDESLAVPFHVPATLAAVDDGAEGEEDGEPPPPHAAATPTTSTANPPSGRLHQFIVSQPIP
jgi:hypothetical protein